MHPILFERGWTRPEVHLLLVSSIGLSFACGGVREEAGGEVSTKAGERTEVRVTSTLEPTPTMPYRITVESEAGEGDENTGLRHTLHDTHVTIGWPTGEPRQFIELHWAHVAPEPEAWGPTGFRTGPFPWSEDNSGHAVAHLPIGGDMWTIRCHATGAEAPTARCTEILQGVRVERVPNPK